MSVHFAEHLRWGVPLLVFAGSISGSAHCLAMCGGLVTAVAPSKKSALSYHLGRLLSYAGLGALAGAAGSLAFLDSANNPWINVLSFSVALMLALAFFTHGVRQIINLRRSGLSGNQQSIVSRFHHLLMQKSPRRLLPFSTGFFSGLLPCGWLHGFVAVAASTGTPLSGVIIMAIFWLGTTPALTVGPLLLRKLTANYPAAGAAFFMLAGILTIALKIASLFGLDVGLGHGSAVC